MLRKVFAAATLVAILLAVRYLRPNFSSNKEEQENGQVQASDSATEEDQLSLNRSNTSKQESASSAQSIEEMLESLIERYTDETEWTRGERTEGELAGTWQATDGSKAIVVFEADGDFRETFAHGMAEGKFAISKGGQIVAYSRSDVASLTSHFRLEGNQLIGPKGPNPQHVWVREN